MERYDGGEFGYMPQGYPEGVMNPNGGNTLNSAHLQMSNPTAQYYQPRNNDQSIYNMPPQTAYDAALHGIGGRLQKLDERAAAIGVPKATVPFSEVQEVSPGCSPCCEPPKPFEYNPAEQSWKWTKNGKLKLSCQQPVVPVPVLQEIHRRDRIIEIPQIEVVDAVQPRVYSQDVQHQVPNMQINVCEKEVSIPTLRYVDREVIVPVVTGYTHKFVPKWEIREVPRPVVKYVGEQKIIEVEVPRIKFLDKIVEKEVVVEVVEKKVPKITEVENFIDTVKYVWKPVEKIVYLENVVPKFDVSLDCPTPLIIPYPVQNVKEIPSVMVRKDVGNLPAVSTASLTAPSGTVRVPAEYINQYTKSRTQTDCGTLSHCFDCCTSPDVVEDVDRSQAIPIIATEAVDAPITTNREKESSNASEDEDPHKESESESSSL